MNPKNPNPKFQISGNLLARNTTINFIGQVVPFFVAVFTIPYVVHGLGVERFGIMSLAWIVLAYFNLFDLGLGRAATKFVAEALGKGEVGRIPGIVWTSIAFHLLLGTIGTLLLVIATPFLIEKILNITPSLIEEAKLTFYIMSVSITVVMCSGSLRGVLAAGQRFDLLNAVNIPASIFSYLIPVIALFFGFNLPGIVFFLTILKVVTALAHFLLCFRVFPVIKKRFSVDMEVIKPIFTYGGWITLCNIITPVLLYLDRFLISTLHSVAALAYYTVPYQIVSRFQVFPASFVVTLFPALSTVAGSNQKDLVRLYGRSLKYTLLVMGPIVFICVFFAGDILRLWLGNDFAEKCTRVFQILAIGMLLNAMAQMPANLLDAVGRPDLRAKVFLSYVVPYVGTAWVLISEAGIVGAALAWSLRGALELGIFFYTAQRLLNVKPVVILENGFIQLIGAHIAIFSIAYFAIIMFAESLLSQVTICVLCLIGFAIFVWIYLFDSSERRLLLAPLYKMKGWAYEGR